MENNEEIVALLREILDVQKQHFESYKVAVQNQLIAMENQKKAMRMQRLGLGFGLAIVIATVTFLAVFLHR